MECFGNEADADAFHAMLARRSPLQDRALGLNRDGNDGWALLLQETRYAGECSAGAHPGYEPVHAALHLLPDLDCRGVVVVLRVGLILKLERYERARNCIACLSRAGLRLSCLRPPAYALPPRQSRASGCISPPRNPQAQTG